jgi:uncharacterized protein
MTTDTSAIQPAMLTPPPPQIPMSPLELDGCLTGIIVTPQAAPIRPSAWMARLWGDDEPIFEDEAQINTVLGAVAIHYNTLLRDIDRSLKRMEADRIVVSAPVRVGRPKASTRCRAQWVHGFWKAMELAPETWSALAQDERINVVLAPFAGFFDLGDLAPHEVPADIDDKLDEDAALIPRMILVLRKLARIRETTSRPEWLPRQSKIGRNDPCPCGSGRKFKKCCGAAGNVGGPPQVTKTKSRRG